METTGRWKKKFNIVLYIVVVGMGMFIFFRFLSCLMALASSRRYPTPDDSTTP